MARSKVSFGIETLRACSTTKRSRALDAGSAPLRAAIMMSLARRPNSLPLALAASSLPFAFHCAPMSEIPVLSRMNARGLIGGLLYTLKFKVQ